MPEYALQITLLSDATFGRGDGVVGLVNQEVEHDSYGLPIVHGRTLKGLLVDACSEILFGLNADDTSPLGRDAAWLFGGPGSRADDTGHVYFGSGQVEPALGDYLRHESEYGALTKADVFDALTTIRRQTAMNEHDIPSDGSLRAQRVVVRETIFIAPIRFELEPTSTHLALLAACAAGVQRGGSGRTRGRGRVMVTLEPSVPFEIIFQKED